MNPPKMIRPTILMTSLLACLLTTFPLAAEDPPRIVALRKTLQEKKEDFLKVEVNTRKEGIGFETHDFKGKTFEKDGETFFAFRFTAPETGGDLVWAFRLQEGLREWYIVPAEGEMKGFTHFLRRYLKEDLPGVGKEGEMFILQTLPGKNLNPGSDYIMWFGVEEDGVLRLPVSLNFLSQEERDTFGNMFPMFR